MRTAIFFGAGASKPLGLPITKDIFPKLLERLDSKPPSEEPLFGGNVIDQKRLKRCLRGDSPRAR